MSFTLRSDKIDEYLEQINDLRRHRARTSFIDFIDYIWDCKYQWNWHHDYLAKKLQDFYDGKISRMMVFMPPRFGKSELVSKLYVAWALGRNPNESILGTAYAAELASLVNRDIQRIIMSPAYSEIFPDTQLSASGIKGMRDAKRTNTSFEVIGADGFYHSAGVNGPITGMGFTTVVIDDPVKNHQEAESRRIQKTTHKWYSTDVYSRLEKDGKILLVQTRWNERDLAGMILRNSVEGWTVINFPAIKTDSKNKDDPRMIGDALWPEKYSLETLETIKKQQGSRYFASLYQQTPTAQEGDIFKRSWFVMYDNVDVSGATTHFTIDSAYGSDPANDATAILAYCRIGSAIYIKSCKAVRYEFPELINFLPNYVKENGYTNASKIYIEPKASGQSIYQQLKSSTDLNIIKDKSPTDSKSVRAMASTAKIEAGRVLFSKYGSGIDALIDQCCGFPGTMNDDMMDALVMAIRISFQNRSLRMRGRSA